MMRTSENSYTEILSVMVCNSDIIHLIVHTIVGIHCLLKEIIRTFISDDEETYLYVELLGAEWGWSICAFLGIGFFSLLESS